MAPSLMGALPGISGSLLPGRYLEAGVDEPLTHRPIPSSAQRSLRAWWRHVEAECGPATGMRTLFDVAAMPLFALLGFRARDARIGRDVVHARLETARGVPVTLAVLPWARRAPSVWRSIASHSAGARWGFVLSPPFLSIVDLRGHASRHSVDFAFPAALDDRSLGRLWLLAESSAFEPDVVASAHNLTCLVSAAARFQDGVRADLQKGVLDALAALTPAIADRRPPRRSSSFHEALTLVYRVLFLLFAESRDLVPRSHEVYGRAYSIASLCRLALHDGREIAGLWDALAAISRVSRTGCRADDLIVRPFNGQLFARAAAPTLEARRPNRRAPRLRSEDAAIARALVALGTRRGRAGREEIAYADLGVEQLGAVYERVLDVDPCLPTARSKRHTHSRHSAQRKQSGTFYTPQPLAEYVVRRTLAPLVSGATADQVLDLRVVDPSMGSGAFLVAACRFLTTAYERALVEEGRCADTDLDGDTHASHRRLVAERCLAGVDLNPVAVQLARLSLWLTTLSKGKPLSFLDHRLRTGNSLIGTSPEALWRTPARGARAAPADLPLFDDGAFEQTMQLASRRLSDLLGTPDATVADIKSKESLWEDLSGEASPLRGWRLACSLWCARYFWPRDHATRPPSDQELRAALDALLRRDRQLAADRLGCWATIAAQAAATHGFFHWPLEFPDVFPRTPPGFDAVIGNPPWEMLRSDAGRAGPRAGDTDDGSRELQDFVRHSTVYRRCSRGHLNLYQPFVERSLRLARPGGRVGLVLPWSLATDDGASDLRAEMLDRCRIDAIVGLDNGAGLFPIHRGLRFMAVTLTTSSRGDGPSPGEAPIRARFGVRDAGALDALPALDEPGSPSPWLRLERDFLRVVGGRGRRIPDVRHRDEIDRVRRLFDRFPPLGDARGCSAQFGRELNATDDRAWFGADGLPVIEGKHLSPFMVDIGAAARRIAPAVADRRLPRRPHAAARLGYRDVSAVGNRLALIAAVIPANVVTTHTVFCLRTPLPIEQQHYLCALFNSSVLNALVRMLMGSHVTTSLIAGLPVPPWTGSELQREIAASAARLAGSFDATRATALDQRVRELYGETEKSAAIRT